MCSAPAGPVKCYDAKFLVRRVLTQGRAPQDGHTPLWMASLHGNVVAARLLLEAGANTEAKDTVGARRAGEGVGWVEKCGCISCFMLRVRGAGNCVSI